ncbi:LamG-like jellyroll fold domain-containing protein [Citricoccus sp. I39-566]|uniref:LamG-like jellyroll fold domain-containing protein n=1 Tax=Citricoccus sp. I39-566 TaxID=3073268 RepID=UPI00286CD61E|nr:LamG-like jellyroll fold domain-containing protein [Citricoccus sp. I39-566]WMY78604.1 LamG-like jellyroll fold domain-containing protein [Citricoccus sp. I39-566]
MTAKRLPLAVLALSVGLTSTGALMPVAATAAPIAPAVNTATAAAAPAADLLDVDFEDGTAADAAQGREAVATGDPEIGMDGSLARYVGTFDGDDAYSYALTDQDYTALADGFTVECNFKRDAAATSGEDTLCGNKEAGGFAMVVKGDQAGFMIHAEGGYTFAWADIDAETWYHAAGVYDGESIKLYLDGELAAEAEAGGPMTIPANENAHAVVLGADSGNGVPGQFSAATLDAARLYSAPASAEQVAALNAAFAVEVEAPAAEVFNVDFADGTSAETAQGLEATTHGAPVIEQDAALGRNTATFDGDDALLYPLGDQYATLGDSMTVECVFRYNGDLPTSGETNMCANKEGGGFSMTMYADRLTFAVNTGSYHNAGIEIEPNEWYHAVGVFDGGTKTVKLYVNGELVAENPTANAEIKWPPNAKAHNMVLGADASNGGSQFHANATIASARVFGDSLDAQQIAALNIEAFDGLRAQVAELAGTTPAAGSDMTRATEFTAEWANPGLVAAGTSYTLDGEPIEPGQVIGSGMAAGEHTIAIEGKTVFGLPISESVTFTSGSIPVGGGTETGQGDGKVSLSARAVNPDGGDVTTTFYAGETAVAEGGFQGLVDGTPTTLEFDYTEDADLEGAGDSLSATAGQMPFQRFDVEVGEAAEDQSVRWAGTVDPSRQVNLLVWNTASESWDELASGRGLNESELVLSGALGAEHLDEAGQASVLVLGEDPFADDLENEVADSFEDPADYDFSLAHFTDTQYLAEGAAEDAYSEEQQAVWADAYTSVAEWIVANAEEKKIDYVAHTGDIMENWHTGSPRADEEEYREIAVEEFEFVSQAQKILDDSEIPNGVTPGNHDNRSGMDVGPDNLYNQYFGPERYEALEQTQGWKDANASYTPWKEGDNDNHYDLFSAGGLDFVAVYLGYDVTDEEIAWASEVLDQYSDRNAMIMTHAQRKPSTNPDGRGATFSHDGAKIDEGLLQKHSNIFLALSGHEHGVDIEVRKDVGTEGNNVVELLADYQFYTVSAEELGLTGVDGRSATDMLQFGSSFFRLLQIDVDNAEMAVDTYSPLLDNFGATEYDDRNRYNGTEDDTRLPIQLETRKTSFATNQVMVTTPTDEEIGEATAKSGWPATIEWAGLTEGETYAWYATSRDAETGEDLAAGETEQMGVFTAVAAGTDTVAPELTVPEAATLTVGDEFDPLAGVSATDNTDGDVTASVQVIGSVDTATAGAYTLTYVAEDANGNQAIASRAVVVEEADQPEPVEDFTDNAEGSQFYAPVRWMQEQGITTGYTDGTYRKGKDISRGESVAFIHRYIDPEVTDGTEDFTDITESNVFFDEIVWAANAGVTTGYADGTFLPYDSVTRGEFASFLFRAVEPEAGEWDESFSDVAESHPHHEAISWLASAGVSTGYKDGTFKPNDTISRGEVAALMQRYATEVADQG